jgi:tetratricopeptide (TPR) repeat protein
MVSRLKICVYAVALNEAKHVKRFCDSARDADLIFVADTGSVDDTVKLLEDEGATVAHISIKPWRFDDARNAALAMLPADFDVCMSLDLDEELQPGWRAEIERVWVPGTTRLRYGFDWGAGIAFQYEKCHARKGYRWWGACHEYPVPDRFEEVWADTDQLLVIHKPDPTKSRGQYLDLLRISIEESPTEPRNAFYYARELSFNGRWQEAIDQCKRYLDLPRATWINERAYAMRVIGRCYQELNDWEASLKWLRFAAAQAPYTREPWHDLALACYRCSRWPECFGAAMTCLSITNREKLYTVDPQVWGAAPHDLASIAAWNMGLRDVALEQARAALALDPDEFRLRENVRFMSEPMVKDEAA